MKPDVSNKVVRIAGASGALNDSVIAVPQLLKEAEMHYLAFDYLGEGAMGMMRRLREADPKSGFLTDFVDLHIGPYLAELKHRGIKVISNAGGMNPEGLADMIRQRAGELNLDIRVGVVTGDDIDAMVPDLRAQGVREMFNDIPFPEGKIGSINAYLGAFPIAAALDAGADIVITGRVVDSALILGPLIHEFGWGPEDFDLLAAGSAAGHLLECGTQVTGGTFTDWRDVPDWANIGFPIGECRADGSCIITKPEGTGGLVSIGTVAEQLLYEVSDTRAYYLPDVVCDFSEVKLEQVGENRVLMTGVKGYPPTDQYKVCLTYDAGWRSVALIPIVGLEAPAKARRTAEALLKRTSDILRNRNQPDWQLTHVEVIGAEASYASAARPLDPREVLLKIVVDHEDPGAAAMFNREQSTAIMNMAVGTSIAPIIAAPRAFPLTEVFLFLIDKDKVPAYVTLEGKAVPFADRRVSGFDPAALPERAGEEAAADGTEEVPLLSLAWTRSGDKGRLFNVGVIARKPEYLPYIRASLTADTVAECYRDQFDNPAERRVDAYDAPGFHALNFVVHDAQGGGISMSPRFDAAAKTMGQRLLEVPVKVPAAMARAIAE
ncbi:MAG: DUF1446 domain-containing protein [Rhodocyclaceae bacterium]|nr:MAG: DUF1446 domain-containing protein [Rhodocyclaceae bacterium]